ncbi:MAG: FAD-dependent oxidoreductase [Gallionellaceae bacterium]
MSNHYIVVGAGALGLASAEALLMQGASVTVLERGNVGQESSWAGGGILSPLCPWDYPEVVNQLALRGADKFSAWSANLHSATGIDPQYQKSGMLVLPSFDKSKAMQWCVQHQVRYEDKDEGLLLPDAAQARNPRVLQALRAHVAQLGGQIIEQCEVKEFVAEGDVISKLRTSRGDFIANRYVVAAGAWSKQVLAAEANQLGIKPIRGQMLLFKFETPPLQHILLQNDMYLIPRRDGHLLVGSTLEDVGFDKSTTHAARDMLWHRASLLLPALKTMPFIKHWAGLRPGSPNNIPTIGKHPRLENLYLNSGHFRYGVTMAPASVEVLLNEINGKPQPFDVSPYRWVA